MSNAPHCPAELLPEQVELVKVPHIGRMEFTLESEACKVPSRPVVFQIPNPLIHKSPNPQSLKYFNL